MSKTDERPAIPKSIRHKKILDRAAEHPDASLEELADDIPSATPELVEHVLEEYGDPGEDTPPASTTDERSESDDESSEAASTTDQNAQWESATETSYPSLADLSEKQRQTLRAIHENPTATQGEIADRLGVSAPTVSNRVNDLENFEWQHRRAFVDAVFDETESKPDSAAEVTPERSAESSPTHSATDGGTDDRLDRLEARLASLERELEEQPPTTRPDTVFDEPELFHKVVHACMDSDVITQDEELEILKAVVHAESADDRSGH